ncbi:MAG: 2-hydroxyacyl-CoA dehydratase family protein [Polyangia bacterium]|jgi:benzoyl-CoA reductase/2-hydroxyglutaryl-CoA dehydratase subunit BcrC/BadD/HgdB|nr:2-hydroxyacyl-CoA dehydratase family protein [Polyangia bacterium]
MSKQNLPDRNQVIREQKEGRGRKVLGVLPIHYPKELLTAMDVLAVEIWGPPGAPRSAQVGRLQSYVCAVARNALAFVAGGGADLVDGFLYPHTCDSIQGLATQIPDFGGAAGKAALRYRSPKGKARPSLRRYLREELARLAREIEALTGRALDPERLRWSLGLHHRIDSVRAELLDGRARFGGSDAELYGILRRGECLWPEDHLSELERVAERLEPGPVQKGTPLLVSGIVPEPMEIFDRLADAGAYVAGDDYAAIGRRVVREAPDLEGDPLDALAARMLAAPPCSTRSSDLGERLAHLDWLRERGGCAGVVLHTVKFCEPELFDVSGIRSHLASRGLPLLVVEGELESELSGQVVTRLEAFVEMVAAARGNP